MLFRRKRIQDFDQRIPLVASRKMAKYEKVYFFYEKMYFDNQHTFVSFAFDNFAF
jgi:hypothetical protein